MIEWMIYDQTYSQLDRLPQKPLFKPDTKPAGCVASWKSSHTVAQAGSQQTVGIDTQAK